MSSLKWLDMKIHVGGVRFSCAHFVEVEGVFEHLHGHNFKVSADVSARGETGMVMDFRKLQAVLEEVTSPMDHRFLLPGRNPNLSTSMSGSSYDIVAGGKRYRMPETDVVVLPIGNSTAEEIGRHIYDRVSGVLPGGVSLTRVILEEAEGKQAIIESS